MAKIKDVAEKAGVSITTVSRVLNYDDSLSVSNETRQKIFNIASELEYKTPRMRKVSIESDNYNICFIHWYDLNREIEDPYYLSIRIGLEKACHEKQINLMKIYKDEIEEKLIQLKDINGLVAIGKFSEEMIDEFKNITPNIVFVNSTPADDNLDCISIDFNRIIPKMIDFLIDKGYQDFAYIGGDETPEIDTRSYKKHRYENLVESLKNNNIYNESRIYIGGSFDAKNGYATTTKLIEENNLPGVIVYGNDNMAIGGLKALYEKGINVPSDVGVFGFNDISISKYAVPSLSTVRVHTEFMGETALDLLIERIEGRSIPKRLTIPTQIIERESLK